MLTLIRIPGEDESQIGIFLKKNPEVRKERAIDNFFQEFQFHEKERNIRAVAKGKCELKGDCFKDIYIKACLYINQNDPTEMEKI